jgi:3,4-dihydroxy-9,10-secoandrosta-1,3,5(10)-triene-9,17-dione 4,5-dioxygenase
MTEVRSLGYLGVTADDVDAWVPYAEKILGVQTWREDGNLYLRYDEFAWRVQVAPGDIPGHLAFVGWEVGSAEDLTSLAARLTRAGFEVTDEPELAQKRRVKGLISTTDPNGVRTEFFHGALIPHLPFTSPAGARFVTGQGGLGHFVLGVTDLQAELNFYFGLLEFKLSDTLTIETPAGPFEAIFTHCNPRHHSVAFAQLPAVGIDHIMLEVDDLRTVGLAMDRAKADGIQFTLTLGQHSNDWMTSFYMKNPTGFAFEYGTGGRLIDDETWTVASYNNGHIWGHEYVGTPPF